MNKSNRTIKKRLSKECADCGKPARVIVYSNGSYRGGHYFGKIHLISKKEWARAYKAGTHVEDLNG